MKETEPSAGMSGFSYGSKAGWSRMLRPKIACITLSIGTHAGVASTRPRTAARTARRTAGISRNMGALPVLREQRRLVALQDAAGLVQLPAFGAHVDAEPAGHELGVIDHHRLRVRQTAQHE